jgi:hypothetical protein
MLTPDQESHVQEIADRAAAHAVASFAGLVLRRLQESKTADTTVVLGRDLNRIFGEALEQFGK